MLAARDRLKLVCSRFRWK